MEKSIYVVLSQTGTMYGTKLKGARYLSIAEGYVSKIGLDKNNEIIGYEYISLGKAMDEIKKGEAPDVALSKNTKTYGRMADAVKVIDPRKE